MMNDEQGLDHFLALHYDVTISERAGQFYAYISELSLVVSAGGVSEAYAAVQAEKQEYFAAMAQIDLVDQIPLPVAKRRRKALKEGLVSFGLKASIVGGIVMVLMLVSLPFVDSFVVKRLGTIPKSVALTLGRQTGRVTSKLEAISDEDRAKQLSELRAQVRALKPYYKELEQLWNDE